LSDPDPQKIPRWRPWLKRLALFVLALALLVGAGAIVLTQHLTRIARWAVHRALPAAAAEISDVTFDGPRKLVIENFVLRDRRTGAEWLRLDSGSIEFSFDDLRHRRLGEIRLVNPQITIAPELLKSLSKGGETPLPAPAVDWPVRRIVCDYAEVSVKGFGENVPDVTFKGAFDWMAPGPDAPLALTLWDFNATLPALPTPFLTLDVIRIRGTLNEMVSARNLASLSISGGQLLLGDALARLMSGPPAPPSAASVSWNIGLVDIAGVRARLEDARETASDISFLINTSLKNLSPAELATSLGGEVQTIEIADLEVLSPYDPFVKVLTMRRVFLRFTLGGLLRKELAEVAILNPSVYVGQDLFWYMDDTQKRLADATNSTPATKAPSEAPGWRVSSFKVEYGRLLVGSGGRVKYGLPLNFRATATDIALDNLASLHLQTVFEIPKQQYEFPDYQLALATREGDLQFAYPPEKNENNLVGKVFFDALRWRQFEASDAWVSATFDISGINGAFGGRLYRGYVSGGFSFLFEDGSPWIGWLSGEGVSLRQLTDILSPQNFRLTGPLDFKLQMDAFGRNIQRVKGRFSPTKPGRMTIGKLDDFLANIPDTWNLLKKSSTRIALEALRDFDYDKADGQFWFAAGRGVLGLELQGPLGSRKFDVVLHADDSGPARWADKP